MSIDNELNKNQENIEKSENVKKVENEKELSNASGGSTIVHCKDGGEFLIKANDEPFRPTCEYRRLNTQPKPSCEIKRKIDGENTDRSGNELFINKD